MSRFASGVTVLGTHDGERALGLTAGAFMSVSLQPPLVALAVPKSGTWRLPTKAERFTVSILAQGQESVADTYRQVRVMQPGHFERLDGLPVVTGSLAWLSCSVHERQEIGDGTLIIGMVEQVGLGEGDALLSFGGNHARLRELQLSD